MKWVDKVDRLLQGRRLSSIESDAGWKYNSLRNAMNTGSMPGAEKGVRLARVLGVTTEWLFDDSLGMAELQTRAVPRMSPDLQASILETVAMAVSDVAQRIRAQGEGLLVASDADKHLAEARGAGVKRSRQKQSGQKAG